MIPPGNEKPKPIPYPSPLRPRRSVTSRSLSLNVPSTPARTIHLTNVGRGELVNEPASACSMMAENDKVTVTPESTRTVIGVGPGNGTVYSGQTQVYSPSIYDRPQDTEMEVERRFEKRNGTDTTNNHTDDTFEELSVTPNTLNNGQPTRGGYAPTPPHPDYQSTINFKQQLVAHTHALHHHIDHAVNRLARTFENANDWTTDQVMRQVDNMTETAENLKSQTNRQNEVLAEIKQAVRDIKSEIDVVRDENREMMGYMREEIKKIRADVAQGRSSLRGKSSQNGNGSNVLLRRDSKFPSRSESGTSGLRACDSRETYTSRESDLERVIVPPSLSEVMSSFSHRQVEDNENWNGFQQPEPPFMRQMKPNNSFNGLNGIQQPDPPSMRQMKPNTSFNGLNGIQQPDPPFPRQMKPNSSFNGLNGIQQPDPPFMRQVKPKSSFSGLNKLKGLVRNTHD